jgi:hypothetical protein
MAPSKRTRSFAFSTRSLARSKVRLVTTGTPAENHRDPWWHMLGTEPTHFNDNFRSEKFVNEDYGSCSSLPDEFRVTGIGNNGNVEGHLVTAERAVVP